MSNRCVQIDLLRGVFSLIVVLHHFASFVLEDSSALFYGGSLGVEFFLFVSGYLMLVSVEKAQKHPSATESEIGSDTIRFLRRKLGAFLPEFLIAWVIGFIFTAAVQRLSLSGVWNLFIDCFWEVSLVFMTGMNSGTINYAGWYLSAMLLAMAILYPMLSRKTNLMSHLVFPLVSLFIYGYLFRNFGHPRSPGTWDFIVYKGMLRTIAGLCAGVSARVIVKRIKEQVQPIVSSTGQRTRFSDDNKADCVVDALQISRFGACCITVVEIICLSLSVWYMATQTASSQDFFYMMLLAVLIILCFSELGIENLPLRSKMGGGWRNCISCPAWLQNILCRCI